MVNKLAIKTSEELLESIRTRIGDQTDDETISFLEDVTDTMNDLNSKASGQEDWKKKYEDNDAEWRKKYTDRFFTGGDSGDADPTVTRTPDPPKDTPKSFEDLFKIGE